MSIKDKVRMEEEEDLRMSEPIFASNRQKGKCSACSEFANIYCINHSVWICVDHWRQHKTDKHKEKCI